MNIVIIGHVCIDHNITEHAKYVEIGSPSAFISKTYRHFPDVSVHIIAPYGKDFTPYQSLVNLYPNKPIRETTLIYENTAHGNLRTQKAFNTDVAYPVDLDNAMKTLISGADIMFFAPLTPSYSTGMVKECMRYTGKDCLKIILPQGYYRSFDQNHAVIDRDFIEADTILPLFDFVIVSDQDHETMHDIARKWSLMTKVIVTLGDGGATYYYNNETEHIPTVPVKLEDIVDSVGSGDIFSASFAYQYKKTSSILDSIRFANAVARQCLFYPSNNLQINISY